ncbi:GIN domain-containing protein [Sphingomonas sp. S2-65]|uniref:GIN domain-containing protein n=1 Tax=Sphingomonas sp. S2-65 TaxID=2903960 RepID=UPI001F2A0A01|nr:DUF2807 domain-containing protein [Sphingomonas sp. S2-65]UYY57461.1 DUF2807 domain-containing protein [Sphingomonas sp. S2-65]
MRILALAPLLTLAAAAPAEQRSYMITSFDRLRVEGPFEVEVVAGSPRAAAIGDRRTLDALSIRVDAGTLVVNTGVTGGARSAGLAKIRIGAPALRAVTITGGAKVRIAELRASRLDLAVNALGTLDVASLLADDVRATLTGEGAMSLAGASARLRVRNLGTGSFDAAALTAEDADLVAQGDGGIRVGVRYTARATALGTGAILVSGHPRCTTSGPGPVTCEGNKPRAPASTP